MKQNYELYETVCQKWLSSQNVVTKVDTHVWRFFFLKLPNMEICSDKGTSINDVTFFPRYFNPFEVNSIRFLQAIGM